MGNMLYFYEMNNNKKVLLYKKNKKTFTFAHLLQRHRILVCFVFNEFY
jgi:hypothetical protein